MDLRVVMIEPKYPGNIGSVARVMKNFGFRELVLVNPCEVTEQARQYAMHAEDVLDNARTCSCLEEALEDTSLAIGTTDVWATKDRNHLRKAFTPWELRERLQDETGTCSLVFGREDFGFLNSELEHMDIVVSIPTSEEYSAMNISHASAVLLYELSRTKKLYRAPRINLKEKEKLFEMFSDYLEAIDYPLHKRKNAKVMFRRIIGRAGITKWEFHTFMGVLSKGVKRLKP